jgi:cell division protein FtsQ
MLKRINWLAVLYTFIWVVCLSGLVVFMSFIEVNKATVKCKDVKVFIPGVRSFIDRAELDNMLTSVGGPLIGRELDKINIHLLENKLKANPFIEKAKIYADMDGVIHVMIEQREPLLRILNYTNQDFYIDKNGFKIPTSPNFTARVLVANGFIMESFTGKVDTMGTKMARDLYKTAQFIQNDTLWSEQIEQLYVNEQSEIEMIPRLGEHKIILGDADSLDVKFRNLLAFYKKALPEVGWNAYTTISVKYANQIVCEKDPEYWQLAADSAKKVAAAVAGTPAGAPAVDTVKVKAAISATNKVNTTNKNINTTKAVKH